MNSLFNNIKIILVQTSHPGNIGSASRAMKTMGLDQLRLVNPLNFPHEQANVMSSGADDILENAQVFPTIQEAIADCEFVIGSSARFVRHLRWPTFDARECGKFVNKKINNQHKVALVFGRERTGLTNEELDYCQYLVHIPSNPAYNSLNVASAVQIMSYECAVQINKKHHFLQSETKNLGEELATAGQIENFYTHLQQTLIDVNLFDPKKPKLLFRRLRRLYGRVQMTKSEIQMLRGIFSAFQGKKL